MIPQEIKSLFDGSQVCWMATADATGVPNVAPMLNLYWSGEQKLVIGDMFMKATAANVQSNGRVCLATYNPVSGRSWKMAGSAKYETKGPDYDMAQAALQKKNPGKSFKGVVVFEVHAVYDQAPGANAGKLLIQL